jgi:hypothetical protein
MPARALANCIAAAGAAGTAVLYHFSPQEYSFYPRCPFYAMTGHYCPGCGATRAIAELLHGHVAAALHFNAAMILLLPVLLWYFGAMYWTAVQNNRVEWPELPRWTWRFAVAGAVLFGIARNISAINF